MKHTLLFTFLLFNFFSAQKNTSQVIDSILIYKEKIRGETTANMWSRHNELFTNKKEYKN
ncbi:hypothetical protein JSO59_010825 [Riemerella anatipestifer]|uniref:hypothetical protein n=1 Tax=Riemerella anatipestifer TaxID=34085 RepID=UPI0030C4352F